MKIYWFVPTHGDGRYLGTGESGRPLTHEYLSQVATAADQLGFYGVLIPTGKTCEDPWVTASSLIPLTKRLKFLIAVRPGIMSPTVAARMAASFDRFSKGRLLINVVAGGDPAENAGDGLFLSHESRYEATDEFLQVWRRELAGETVDFTGQHIRVQGGSIVFPPFGDTAPPVLFGGSSPKALEVAAKHTNVYLTWGEPPDQVAEKIAQVRALAKAEGRTVRFGIRLHVIVRETEEEAWSAADQLISRLDDQAIKQAQGNFAKMESVGQHRMAQLHGGDRNKLVVSPNLWAGPGLVRGGCGTALVGNPEQVAARMKEYAELGIEHFIFSGYPHLEEAYRVAELLFPKLPLSHGESIRTPITRTDSFRKRVGEVVGMDYIPASALSQS